MIHCHAREGGNPYRVEFENHASLNLAWIPADELRFGKFTSGMQYAPHCACIPQGGERGQKKAFRQLGKTSNVCGSKKGGVKTALVISNR